MFALRGAASATRALSSEARSKAAQHDAKLRAEAARRERLLFPVLDRCASPLGSALLTFGPNAYVFNRYFKHKCGDEASPFTIGRYLDHWAVGTGIILPCVMFPTAGIAGVTAVSCLQLYLNRPKDEQ